MDSDLSKLDLKNASVQQPPFPCNDPLLFVIPSEAEGSAGPRTSPGNAEYYAQTELSSRPEESWACGPPKVMKNASVRHPRFMESLPFPCHPDRSEPGFPATQC